MQSRSSIFSDNQQSTIGCSDKRMVQKYPFSGQREHVPRSIYLPWTPKIGPHSSSVTTPETLQLFQTIFSPPPPPKKKEKKTPISIYRADIRKEGMRRRVLHEVFSSTLGIAVYHPPSQSQPNQHGTWKSLGVQTKEIQTSKMGEGRTETNTACVRNRLPSLGYSITRLLHHHHNPTDACGQARSWRHASRHRADGGRGTLPVGCLAAR